MRFVVSVRRLATILAVSILSACGTGSTQPLTTVSTNSISFVAVSPDAAAPNSQTVTAAVSAGAVSLAVLHSGSAIGNVTQSSSGNTTQIVVDPASPGTLGAGNFTGIITVTGYSCSNAACSPPVSGNSQVVNVSYLVPPIVREVAPYVGFSASGNVIIRGQGFDQFPVQNVLFNGSPIYTTSFSVVSDTEIEASYSGLVPGTYAVNIQVPPNAGTVTSGANLVIMNPQTYSATTVPYPAGLTVSTVNRILYDPVRQDLVVAVGTSPTGPGEILDYPYSVGVWATTPNSVAVIPSLSDIALSTQGKELLALSQQGLTQLTPATLGQVAGTTTSAPSLPAGSYFKNLAVVNDGTAILTTGYAGSQATPLYEYAIHNTSAHSLGFFQLSNSPSLDNSTPAASLDGSVVALVQGDSSLLTAPSTYYYTASSASFGSSSATVNQNAIPPSIDGTAAHVVLNGTYVYDANYNLLGTLQPPGTDTPVAVAISPDGSTAYMYDSAGVISSFNLLAGAVNGVFVANAQQVTPPNPGSSVSMAISPDGKTLFLAGTTQIVVQPVP